MRFLLVALLITLAVPAAAEEPGGPWAAPLGRQHALVGRIWSPPDRRFLSPEELARRLAAADFVMLGERHDNPDHHRLQAWSLGQIVLAGRRPVIAFEMIGPEQEDALDRQLAEHPNDVDGLGAALDWAHSNWPDWAQYRPLFAQALAAGLPVRPANLDRASLRAIARSQPLTDEARRFYRLDQALDPTAAAAMADEIRDAHCGQLPERAVPGMVDVQRARDATMAHAMVDAAPAGAVLIAGAGHTRTDRGIPTHLAALAPGRSTFSLAFVEVADGRDDPAGYGEAMGAEQPPFDAIWFTPRASDDDPCAELIEFMKKKKEQQEQK